MHRAALIFLAVFWAWAATTAADAKRVALVVGINAYDNLDAGQQLQKARGDARAVAATLKEAGFQVILAEDTGRTAFLRSWQRFLDTVAPGDVTAVFFSGHGIEINGSNYLLVRDVPQAADGEEVLKNSGLRLQSLMDRLKDQKPQVSLFIIDACRNSPYASQGGKRSLGSVRGLRPEDPAKGSLIMMSAGAGQEALDALSPTDPDPNSIYTRTLLPLLKEPGLEITDLAKRLRGNVEALAATVRHEQRPAFYHELSGDFFLVPRPVAAPTASEPAVAWGATKDTTSPAVLEAFIRQFPGTVYASMARARLEELRKSQVAAVGAPTTAGKATILPPPAPTPAAPTTAAPAAAAPKAAAPAPAAATPPTGARPEQRIVPSVYEAAQAWATARESKDPSVLEAFLARFGETIYGPMARTHLQELQGTKLAVAAPPAAAPTPPVAAPAAPSVIPAAGIFPSARAAAPLATSDESKLKPGDTFSECTQCPEMVVLPAGGFVMGSPADEEGRAEHEGPQRTVTFAAPFAAGKHAVSFEEWDACVAGGGCNGYRPTDDGRPRGRYPVINVSFEDAQAYVAWLSRSTGKPYRLLSEAEREYVARAGTTTPFWWGRTISSKQANYDGTSTYGGGEKGEYRQRPVAVDTFAPNAFGLHQVHGNVNEWTADCWRGNYREMSTDGTVSTVGVDCGRRVLRGGSWYDGPQMLRAAARVGLYPGFRSNKIGFRVARSI